MYSPHRPAKKHKTSSAPPSLISRLCDECSRRASHARFFLLFSDDNCRLSEYRRLKSKMLDLHDKRYTSYNTRGAHNDNMAVRKQLVDVMFKRFDANGDGRVEAGELSQVRLESEKKSCSTAGNARIQFSGIRKKILRVTFKICFQSIPINANRLSRVTKKQDKNKQKNTHANFNLSPVTSCTNDPKTIGVQ